MRAHNLEVLTGDVQAEYGPGVTVWGKGDKAHQSSISDHNEDDTPGSKSEQQDADNIPEHRALDIPFLGPFSEADAHDLRRKLTERPANQRRLRYVILGQIIWRKKGGWKAEHYTGEYHGHLHVSSDVADDENGAHWDIGPVVTQQVQRRKVDMFLIHKVVNGTVTFALIGPDSNTTWKAGDVIQTTEGPIDGQSMANAWARGIGDSRLETPLAFAALTMARKVVA